MKFPRGLLGALLWILASLVGLLGIIACVTLILLPVGIPLLMLARRLFGRSMRLFMPPAIAHPLKETGRQGRKTGEAGGKLGKRARRNVADAARSARKDVRSAKKKTNRFLRRRRKQVA